MEYLNYLFANALQKFQSATVLNITSLVFWPVINGCFGANMPIPAP